MKPEDACNVRAFDRPLIGLPHVIADIERKLEVAVAVGQAKRRDHERCKLSAEDFDLLDPPNRSLIQILVRRVRILGNKGGCTLHADRDRLELVVRGAGLVHRPETSEIVDDDRLCPVDLRRVGKRRERKLGFNANPSMLAVEKEQRVEERDCRPVTTGQRAFEPSLGPAPPRDHLIDDQPVTNTLQSDRITGREHIACNPVVYLAGDERETLYGSVRMSQADELSGP